MRQTNKGAQICNHQPKKLLEKSQNETKSRTLTKNKVVTLESSRELGSKVPASSLRRNSERPRVRVTRSRKRGGQKGNQIHLPVQEFRSRAPTKQERRNGINTTRINEESMSNRRAREEERRGGAPAAPVKSKL
jgi:hypothetical protein